MTSSGSDGPSGSGPNGGANVGIFAPGAPCPHGDAPGPPGGAPFHPGTPPGGANGNPPVGGAISPGGGPNPPNADDMIDGYIALKMEEVTRFRMTTHPVEYDMYFSL